MLVFLKICNLIGKDPLNFIQQIESIISSRRLIIMKQLGITIGLCCIVTITTSLLITQTKEVNLSFAREAGTDIPGPIYTEVTNIIKQSSKLYGSDIKKNIQNIYSMLLSAHNSFYNIAITKTGMPNNQDQYSVYPYKGYWMTFKEKTDPENPQWSYLLWRSQNFSKFGYIDTIGRGIGMNENLYNLIQMYIQDNQQVGNCHAIVLKDILSKIVPEELWNVVCQSTDELQLTAYLSPRSDIWSVHSYLSKLKGNGHYLIWASYQQ